MNAAASTAPAAPAAVEVAAPGAAATPAPLRPWANRNFRWLALGGLVSMLGDQFTLLALPWLVLRISGDPLALGTVIAAMALPRALLMLVGGAIVDRHAPRRVLLLTRQISAVLLALLALGVAIGAMTLPWIHVFAVALGITTAFSHPAASAILPRAVPPALIRPGNALLMAMRQVTMLAGPLLAAALIAGSAATHELSGLAWAFALDAASFALAALALWPVTMMTASASSTAPAEGAKPPILASIAEGLRALWNDPLLRALCLYVTAIGLLVGGPLQVALPVLAERQLHGDATTLGLLTAGHGAGLLAGLLLAGRAGRRSRPEGRGPLVSLGGSILLIDAVAGLVFIALGQASHTWQAIALLAPIGAMAGFVQVAVMSWIQRRVPPRMLGRAMSVLLFLVLGLTPLSSALAGWLLRGWSTALVFSVCGAAMLAVVAIGAVLLPMRRIEEPSDAPARTADQPST